MFGCLRKIINIIIIILAVVGFIAVGGTNIINDFIHNPLSPAQTSKSEKAAQIADFSKLNKEFELVSSSKLPKIGNYVYVKHAATSQNFFMAKPKNAEILTKADFNTKKADEKIMNFVNDFKVLRLENFEITGRGSMHAFEQTVPFVKYKAKIEKFPMHMRGTEGIVGVALKDNKNVIIVVANEKGKYSQIVTDALFTEIK